MEMEITEARYLKLIRSFIQEGDISYLKRIGSVEICYCVRKDIGAELVSKIWLLYSQGHIDKDTTIEMLGEANRISTTVFPKELYGADVPSWVFSECVYGPF
jgi:hypothetical protein